jgi:sirohydrochlorin cobaltochelatase
LHGIVLFAHGAREADWAKPFEAIRDRVRAARPEHPIALAYLEIMRPTLEEAIQSLVDEGAPAITVFPIFLAQGGHLKHDLPRILAEIRAGHPHVPIGLETSIGEVPAVLDALSAWILERVD